MRSFKPFFLFFIFALSLPAFAQSEKPWWYILEEGKLLFREGSYGDALIAFEDARRARLAQFTRMEQDFILLLSAQEVRRLGDSLERIEIYIAGKKETAAAGALAALYHYIPKETFRGSAALALEGFDRLKSYPEADYWLGETCMAEGEPGLALRHYERAWESRTVLETPAFEIEILNKITDVYRVRREHLLMEKYAREIIEGVDFSGNPRDVYWAASPGGDQVRGAMARVLENEGVNRFLVMYRYNNNVTENAHRLLGMYYYASRRYPLAFEHLMFSFLIQTTLLIEEAVREQFDFTFTNLENLLEFADSRPELASYIEKSEYYKTVYYLAAALFACGKTRPSRELWAFLAGNRNSGEWGVRARNSGAPFVDPQPALAGG